MFRNLSPGIIMKNKLFLGTVIVLLAVAVGFVVVPAYNAQTRKTVKVWQAKTTIYQYQQITAGMIRQVEVGSYGLSPQAVRKESDIVGKTAKTKIVPGDNILSGQLLSGRVDDEFLTEISAKGERAASVSVPNLASVVSGQIVSGDVVSIVTYGSQQAATNTSGSNGKSQNSSGFSNGVTGNTATGNGSTSPILYPDLTYLQVASVSDKNGDPINGIDTTKSANGDNTAIPGSVTFVCNEKQALELAQINKKGDAYLVFVARGAEAEKIIAQQGQKSSAESSSSLSGVTP